VDRRLKLIERAAAVLTDPRDPDLITHSQLDMLRQRVYAIVQGYEDLNDHEQLRNDPLFGVLAGRQEFDKPLAGKSTLNRLELGNGGKDRYKKITFWKQGVDELLVSIFIESQEKAPEQIILDVDTTDLPLHGKQEGRFFHGYYDSYCYLPLYVTCGRHLLAAKLRRSNIDGSAGAERELDRIIGRIRAKWPWVRILVRADSGFTRERLMAWCEANNVDFVFGLARNKRLAKEIEWHMARAETESRQTGQPARRFKDFQYATRQSWSRRRRVIGKAEWTQGEANPRFIVTSLSRDEVEGRHLYEKIYCARGDMENRIKECQIDMFADRTSAATMRANQLRLWLSSMAYVLLCALRRIGLGNTRFAKASCGSIRLALLKIGAVITTSVRRVKIAMASGCPYQHEFRDAHALLTAAVR
jgi:hypothetical protein